MKRFISSLLFIYLLAPCFSQTGSFEQVTISNTQLRHIQSRIVDQEYSVLIHLPNSYQKGKLQYPVLYLLDAQWDFPLFQALYGQQYFDGFIPEMIIVGITWAGENANPDSLRARDFTPTKIERLPQSGGAENFLLFIKNELIPFVKKEYRVTDQRALVGSSLGGLFTLYALFSDPTVFKYYLPTSPPSDWDNGYLYGLVDDFATKSKNKSLRLFMAHGGLEKNLPSFYHLVAFLEEKNFSGLDFKSKVLEGMGHSGVKAEGNTRGLQYIFKKPSLLLEDNQLNRLTGDYASTGSNSIAKVSQENGHLILNIGNSKIKMSAKTENRFYVDGEFLKLVFKTLDNNIEGFDLLRFTGSSYYKKIK